MVNTSEAPYVRAIHFKNLEQMRHEAVPGSFHLTPRMVQGLFEFRYICPSGSGIEGKLLVGLGHKPGGQRPSWSWNGSDTEPTLQPSVNHVGHWHGWLTDGYWRSV